MTKDQWRLPRHTLRHMMTIMRPDGFPVVPLMEDFEEHGSATRATAPDIIARWALAEDIATCCDAMHFFSCIILQSYRVMVGAISWGYHPDWLTTPRSTSLGHPELPAWDRFGRRVVWPAALAH